MPAFTIVLAATTLGGLGVSVYLGTLVIYRVFFSRAEREWCKRVELCELLMELRVAETDCEAMAEAARRQLKKAWF